MDVLPLIIFISFCPNWYTILDIPHAKQLKETQTQKHKHTQINQSH